MNLSNISIRNATRAYCGISIVLFLIISIHSALTLSALSKTPFDPASDAATQTGLIATVGLIILLAGALWVTKHVAGRIDLIASETENLRAGDCDLRHRLPKMTGGLGRLCVSLNGFIVQIHDVLVRVNANAGEIEQAARQISAGNADLSARTEAQASNLEETASSMEEFTSSVRQNAKNSKLASAQATTASAAARRGGEIAARAAAKINAANESSRKIGSIIATIDSIAFQTNILALNAAVEAARAGEQGRGFAVVAGEVRGLAERSACAAKEIKGLIVDAIDKVDDGAKLVGEAGQSMQEIIAGIERAAVIIDEIATASAEQYAGIEQVNRAIVQMEEVTQQNAALVEQAAAASDSMRDQAISLTQQVSRFKFDDEMRQDPVRIDRPTANAAPVRHKGANYAFTSLIEKQRRR